MKDFRTVSKDVSGNEDYIVYAHTLYDGRKYIGITSQKPQRRWRSGEGYKSENSYFYNAIKKYGWDSFKHEILYENLTGEEAKKIEQKLIAKYKTQDRKKGFNMTGGGDGLHNPTAEQRKRIGEWSKKVNTGRRHTEEYKQYMSKLMKENNPNAGGKCLTPSRIAKFTEYVKKPKTEIQKKRMSKSAKKHRVICVETGAIYDSMKQASEMTGIYYTSLTCAVYDSKRRAGGYHWKTYEEL